MHSHPLGPTSDVVEVAYARMRETSSSREVRDLQLIVLTQRTEIAILWLAQQRFDKRLDALEHPWGQSIAALKQRWARMFGGST